jgi:hypothetical protein
MFSASVAGSKHPVFDESQERMAPDSKMRRPVCRSTIAGILPFGLILRKSG